MDGTFGFSRFLGKVEIPRSQVRPAKKEYNGGIGMEKSRGGGRMLLIQNLRRVRGMGSSHGSID